MSITRISSNQIPDNGLFHTLNREEMMDKVGRKLNTGKKYNLPSENVVDVTQGMTFQTKIHKINQYQRNINDAQAERSLVESKISDSINILQRVRELTIQAANGTYTEEDRKKMAVEVDQLLRNMILNANSKFKGDYLFSGFNLYTKPFETLEGPVRGINDSMIVEVKYFGNNGKHLREIDANEYIAVSKPGSEVFWSEQFQIYSNVNTANFRLTKDQSIMLDNTKITFNEGDNIYAIIDKINRSPAAVSASVDVVNGGLILKTTIPHKLEISDIEGGTLMQDLGILEKGRPTGPDNYEQTATIFSGSIFDVLIGVRDSMIQNNQVDLSGRFLGSIDLAINNLTFRLAETGAFDNRLEALKNRHENDKINYTEGLTRTEDVDITEAITEMRMLEFAHRASLAGIAKLSQVSLMDFIR